MAQQPGEIIEMKIKVIMTDKAMRRETMDDRERMLSAALSSGVEISVDCIKKGPDELDCHTDEAFAAPELVKMAIQAEKDGYDAIVIYCFSDVGLDAVRENVRIPVIAPGEVTLAVAHTICSRFVVVTGASWNIPRTYRRMMKNAIAREKMAAVLALDIPADKMRVNPNITKEHLDAVCRRAVEQHNADGLILGCLGMAGYGEMLEEKYPIKVLDPAFIAVAYAEMCVRLGIRHIPAQYPPFTNESNVELL